MPEFRRNLDYIDVASRLTEMRETFPDLTMQQVSMEFVVIGGNNFVVYTAAAYRTAEDTRPGIGTAWEPIPGPTPFTKDSEVQNAETAAWGRALIAIGAKTNNGIASAEEVSNRSGNETRSERPQNAAIDEVTGEEDPRIAVILKAAMEAPGGPLVDIAEKFKKYGKLSEAQLKYAYDLATL